MDKIQNRFPRLVAGFFLPGVVLAFIAATLLAIGIPVPPLSDVFGSLPGLISLILTAWILGGLQCLIYSALMEFLVNPDIKNERGVILASGFLVSLATWTIPRGFPLILLMIGFVSGCVVGYLLRDMYKYYSR